MDVDVGYSLEFKLNAVKLYLNKYGCYRSVAREVFVNKVTVKAWYNKYKLKKRLVINYIELNSKMSKKKKLYKTKIEISDKDLELKKLQRENELLRMELDVIKKLDALVKKREKNIK